MPSPAGNSTAPFDANQTPTSEQLLQRRVGVESVPLDRGDHSQNSSEQQPHQKSLVELPHLDGANLFKVEDASQAIQKDHLAIPSVSEHTEQEQVANAQAGESTSLAQTFSVEEIFAQINRNRDQIVNPEGLWVLAKYILAYRMRSAGEGTKNGSSLSYPEKGLKLG